MLIRWPSKQRPSWFCFSTLLILLYGATFLFRLNSKGLKFVLKYLCLFVPRPGTSGKSYASWKSCSTERILPNELLFPCKDKGRRVSLDPQNMMTPRFTVNKFNVMIMKSKDLTRSITSKDAGMLKQNIRCQKALDKILFWTSLTSKWLNFSTFTEKCFILKAIIFEGDQS